MNYSYGYIPNPIVLGYMLILILIATIGYAYYNEEQTLVSMETESRNTNNVRCEINRLNMRLTSLTMMGETAFEWTETERGGLSSRTYAYRQHTV